MNKFCVLCCLLLIGSVGHVAAAPFNQYLNYTVVTNATEALYSGYNEYNYSGDGVFAQKSKWKLHFTVNFYDSQGNPINGSVVDLNRINVPYYVEYRGNILVPDAAHWFNVQFYTGVFNVNDSKEFYAIAPGNDKVFVVNSANPNPDYRLPTLDFYMIKNDKFGGLSHYSLIPHGGTVEEFNKAV